MFDAYQCIKTVRAARIVRVVKRSKSILGGGAFLEVQNLDGEIARVDVSFPFIEKHEPEVGGYFVQYENGYESYSPPQAFDEGYIPIDDESVLDFLEYEDE